MNSLEANELHKIWLKFLNSTKTEDGELWLDVFLAKYLNLLCKCDGNTNNSFSFQWKSSGNILAHQLLSDMYQICETVKRSSYSENDTSNISRPFKKYLLEGRGWKILWTLENIGIQNLLCLKELINLLILHVPVLLTLPVSLSSIPDALQRKPKFLPLDNCFVLYKRHKNFPLNIDMRWPANYIPKHKRIISCRKRTRRKKVKLLRRDSSSSSEEDQVVLEPCAIPASQLKALQKVNRVTSLTVQRSPTDAEESDQEFDITEPSLPSHLEEFRYYNISVIEYIHFTLNLFQESCQIDQNSSDYNSTSSSLILEFSINSLKDIQYKRYNFHGWSDDERDCIRDQLLKLVFLSATVTYSSLNFTGAPNENTIMSTLFDISEEIFSLQKHKYQSFVCDVLKGCLNMINNSIEFCSGDYAKVLCAIKTFFQNGANICYSIILSLEETNTFNSCVKDIQDIINLIKEIIIVLKYEKVSLLHSGHFHTDLPVKDFIHHHNDIFGSSENFSDINEESECCVASMSCLLLKIFSLPISSSTSIEIIKQVRLCGICCCLSPEFVLKLIFKRFGSFDSEVQHLSFSLLEKQLLPQLGLTQKGHSLCNCCSKRLNESDILSWSIMDRLDNPSALGNYRGSLDMGSTFWHSFCIYNDLMQSSCVEALENVGKHLIQIFMDGTHELKNQLFIRVILPQFLQLSSSQYPFSPPQKVKGKSLLSVLQIALSNSSSSATFVNLGGISTLYPFILFFPFRQTALNCLKILIFSENNANQTFESLNSYSATVHFPASSSFCDFLLNHTQKFNHNVKSLLLHQKLVEEQGTQDHQQTTYMSEFFTAENIGCISDLWKCYKEVISSLKNDHFYRMSDKVFESGYDLFVILLQDLNILLSLQVLLDKPEVAKKLLLLLQSLLIISIRTQTEISTTKAVLETVKCHLKAHFPALKEFQTLLCDLIIKSCLSYSPAPSRMHKNNSCNDGSATTSSDKDTTDMGSYGDSYGGDTEGSNSLFFSSSGQYEVTHQNFIEHGEVVKMLIELLMQFQEKSNQQWLPTARFVMQELLKLCQECHFNKIVLSEQDIQTLLLESFSRSLKCLDCDFTEYQILVLDLFVTLAQISTQASDLRVLINFFKVPYAPVELLLKCLNTLVDTMQIYPRCSVNFPCPKNANVSQCVKKRLRAAYNTHLQYSQIDDCAWSYSALCFPISEDCRWNAFNKGFGFFLWLKVDNLDHHCPTHKSGVAKSFNSCNNSTRKEKDLFRNNVHMLHVISVGSEKYTLELWYDSSEKDLVVKVLEYGESEVICLSKGVCKTVFQTNVWHHLAVTYLEENHKSIVSSRIQIVIDGVKENIFNLTYKRSGHNVLNNCHLLIGHSEITTDDMLCSAYSIGSFSFFQGDVLTRDIIFYLASLGPVVTSIIDCAIQKRIKFIPMNILPQNLISLVSLDVSTGSRVPTLDHLETSLLCSYTSEKKDKYLIYPPVSRGFFPLKYSFPKSGNVRASSTTESFHQRLPVELSGLYMGNMIVSEAYGFHPAIEQAGGMTIFLFLFVYLLEHNADSKQLSDTLRIILKLLNKNTIFDEDFIRIKGYELLTQMIMNPKCNMTNEIFQVFQQNCLSLSPIQERSLNSYSHKFGKASVIFNFPIFSLMLKSVIYSPTTSEEIHKTLFSLLDHLLDPKFANIHLNVEQMNHIQMLKILLWILKKNYIMSESFLPIPVANNIPILMVKLLEYRFDGDVYQNICHLLLLLHQSSYVCHSRSTFFFFRAFDSIGGHHHRSSSIWYTDIADDLLSESSNCDTNLSLQRTSSLPNNIGITTTSKPNTFSPKTLRMKSANCLETTQSSKPYVYKKNLLESICFDSDKQTSEEDSPLISSKQNESSEICIGLLKLVHTFITQRNSSSSPTALPFLQPEILLILAYTPNADVCVSALKVLSCYLKVANENERNVFLNIKGFHLLANQLHQQPVSSEAVEACFSFITDTTLVRTNLSQVYNSKEITTFHIFSWLPLLALLPYMDSDLQLCEKVLAVLTKFLRTGTPVVQLLENGLCLSVSHLIVRLSLMLKIEENDYNLLESCPCLKASINLLTVIFAELCSSKNSKDFNALCDMLHLLSTLERKCIDEYGSESPSVTSLRQCQCIMYQITIEFAKLYNAQPLKTPSLLMNEKNVWELLTEFQETLSTFSTNSAPVEEVRRAPHSAFPKDVDQAILEISMAESISRIEVLMEKAVQFVIFKDDRVQISNQEREFIQSLFLFCVKGLVISLNKNLNVHKTEFSSLMCSLKESLKKELSRLLLFSLSPNQDYRLKEYFVEILSIHPYKKKLLHLVIFSISRLKNFLIFINDLRLNSLSSSKENIYILFNVICNLVNESSVLDLLTENQTMEKLKMEWVQLWREDRLKWLAEINKHTEKFMQKLESFAHEVSANALEVTSKVFEIQNEEHKLFMEELKLKYYEEASERMTYLQLVEQMTHEKALWHIPDSYPYTWELDPTEGPMRIRRRVKRCFLNVQSRFLLPEHAEKLMDGQKDVPFVNLLLHQNEFPDSAAVLHKLHSHEQIEFTSTCKIVTAFEEAYVEILIGACCIHLIGEEMLKHIKSGPISESWPFESIKEIVPRRYELQNTAFEIFLTNGLTYLIAFDSEKEFQFIWKQLESRGLPCQKSSDLSTLTQLWRDSSLTNFEYLTQLNKLSGRSFNDLMQYPVFPYVLADYVNPYLDLMDPSIYRNFEKPVAIQYKYREKFYKDTFDLLKEQMSEPELPISGPYHYGSHYSNSGTVLHFLIRLLPFTYSFIKYQDNNFDIPDRAFHSVETSWQLVTKDSTSDVKELIPEFFFLPEFLCNKNGFDFGVRQSGIRVNDVLLPPWCKQNPRLFILIHRQALEAETVSKNLHNWVDLVFGYKQTGEPAVNSINVFHPATYYGFDINQWSDPITKQAVKVMIKTLGQMPKQLFFAPHPMVSLSLTCHDSEDNRSDIMSVVDTVHGIRWGSYVGSPATGAPNLVWCRKQSSVLGSLLSLLPGYMFGLGENVCLLLNQKKNTGSDIMSASYIMSAALVSWGHKDSIIRIKLCRDQPALPLLKLSSLDPVCFCTTVPDRCELFVGHNSGLIYVYNLYLSPSGKSVVLEQAPILLSAHTDAITCIYICKAFSVVISASLDKSIVIWDLNRLCYVRSLVPIDNAIQLVTVSKTLGDIACVSNNDEDGLLVVHTINGELVGSGKCGEIVTALCYSTAPEGVSVNVIATGLRSGSIRLWSSWDLKPVREIRSDRFCFPIQCLIFSTDNEHLFASNISGTVAVWEKPSKSLASVPRLLIFN